MKCFLPAYATISPAILIVSMDNIARRIEDDGNAAMLCEKHRGKVGRPWVLARSTGGCTGQLALSLFFCGSMQLSRSSTNHDSELGSFSD
jgi:hypothetical protein